MHGAQWSRDGRRVACRHAGLMWEASQSGRWRVDWTCTLPEGADGGRGAAGVEGGGGGGRCGFDELQLVLYSPAGLHVYAHDGRFGVGSRGKSRSVTAAGEDACLVQVRVYGSSGEHEWESALETILGKLDASGCERLAHLRWEEVELVSPRAATVNGTDVRQYFRSVLDSGA